MANFSKSYDKVALTVALVIALGLGAMVYLNAGKLEKDFAPVTGSRGTMPENPDEERFKTRTGEVGQPVELEQSTDVEDEERKINNFVGVPTFLKKGSELAVDLGDKSNASVHPPIPNQWWLDNRIDPGYADSPERDPDKDGFSNLEEFEAGKNPNDFKDHPALAVKLRCAKVEKKPFMLSYTSDNVLGQVKPSDKFRFRFQDVVGGRQRNINSEYIEAGQGGGSTFFTKGPAQLRFELKKVEKVKEENPRTGAMEENTYAHIEDVSETKKGDAHKIKKGSRYGKIIRDYTAHLYLNAIGQESNIVQVPERTSFALPFDEGATEKPFTFKGINENNEVVIEWVEDGETKTQNIAPDEPLK